jgi:hypothetical protein
MNSGPPFGRNGRFRAAIEIALAVRERRGNSGLEPAERQSLFSRSCFSFERALTV